MTEVATQSIPMGNSIINKTKGNQGVVVTMKTPPPLQMQTIHKIPQIHMVHCQAKETYNIQEERCRHQSQNPMITMLRWVWVRTQFRSRFKDRTETKISIMTNIRANIWIKTGAKVKAVQT